MHCGCRRIKDDSPGPSPISKLTDELVMGRGGQATIFKHVCRPDERNSGRTLINQGQSSDFNKMLYFFMRSGSGNYDMLRLMPKMNTLILNGISNGANNENANKTFLSEGQVHGVPLAKHMSRYPRY